MALPSRRCAAYTRPRCNSKADRLMRKVLGIPLVLLSLALAAEAMSQPDLEALKRQVTEAERAFARSMAERKLDDFARHLSEHAVFYGGGQVLRGKAAVVAGWKAFYDAPKAPFSWDPDTVDVTGDGQLAHSSGLVRDPEGKVVARFNSVWRLEPGGVWRVVFDKGSAPSEADKRAAP